MHKINEFMNKIHCRGSIFGEKAVEKHPYCILYTNGLREMPWFLEKKFEKIYEYPLAYLCNVC